MTATNCPRRIGLRPLAAVAGLVLCMSCAAQPASPSDDPIQSPACRQALAEAESQETMAQNARQVKPPASAPAGPSPAKILALRERAARICLGPGTTGPSPSQHTLRPPVTLAPATPARPVVTAPAPSAPAPTTTAPVVPLRTEPMQTIVGCDATSCWSSDGTRLLKSGPNLIGPRGVCTQQGAVLRCPQ